MHRRLVLTTLAASFALIGAAAEGEGTNRNAVYSLSTIVVFNTTVPESRDIALFYAKARGISADRIVGLNCPAREEITREEYEATILDPLRDKFTKEGWWQVSTSPAGGIEVASNRMHVIALIYGIPLRVRNSLPAPSPVPDPKTGELVRPPPMANDSNACSVDSELALMGSYHYLKQGAINNPFFKARSPFYQIRLPGIILVGRIDGPTPSIAKRLVSDAIAVEESGLWGFAYIDQAQKVKLGDDWLLRSAQILHRKGIPVVIEPNRERFATNYPMRHASFYLGWYTHDADGPLLNPAFRFVRGAVATHIHSFSASTLRSDSSRWAGPMLSRGASAVLGNVYEPFLHATHHLDIFTERLLNGFTLVESAYMASPVVSWMSIVVGDPLYRPFIAFNRFDRQTYAKGPASDLKALRLATVRWAEEDPERFGIEMTRAAERLQSGRLYEAMALASMQRDEFDDALLLFEKALANYPHQSDQFRVQLHRAELARRAGRREKAVAILTRLSTRHAVLPEAKAAKEILGHLRPPLPPLPAPAPSPEAVEPPLPQR